MTGAGPGTPPDRTRPLQVNSDKALFLERHSYRRRRLTDAARVLPILGAGLFLIPLLWPRADDTGAAAVSMSQAILYIFLVWAGLIVASALFGIGARRWGGSEADATNGPG